MVVGCNKCRGRRIYIYIYIDDHGRASVMGRGRGVVRGWRLFEDGGQRREGVMGRGEPCVVYI
jgi:hypothetical protein